MEREALDYSGGYKARFSMGVQALFLALLLGKDETSSTITAAGASRSNLFFSSMFGACAEPNFGLEPNDAPVA